MTDVIEDTFDFVGDVVGSVFDLAEDVVEFVTDDLIRPIGDVTTNIIESAIDNPLKTIAQVYSIITPGMQWALPVIEGADVAAKGGDLNDVFEATAKAYLASEITSGVSKSVGSSVAAATESKLAGQIIGRGVGAAASTIVTKQDPLKAFIAGGVSAAVPAVLGQIKGFEDLPDSARIIIEQAVASQLTGQEPNLAAITAGVLVAQTTTDILKEYDPKGTKLDNVQKAIITDVISKTASTAIAGGNVNGAITKSLLNAGAKALGDLVTDEFKTSTKKVSDSYNEMQKTGSELNKNIQSQEAIANNYNNVRDELDARIKKYNRLLDSVNAAIRAYNANPTQATADAITQAADKYNKYGEKLIRDYEEIYIPTLNNYADELNILQSAHDELLGPYTEQFQNFQTSAAKLGEETDNIASGIQAKIVELTDADIVFKSGEQIASDLYSLNNFTITPDDEGFKGWAAQFDNNPEYAFELWEALNPSDQNKKYKLNVDAVDAIMLPPVLVTADRGGWEYSVAENGLGIAWNEEKGIIEIYDDSVSSTEPIKTYTGKWGENANTQSSSVPLGSYSFDMSFVITANEDDENWGTQVFDFVSSVIDKAKSTNNTALINTVANVTKAGGQILKSFNGLLTFAGVAPDDTRLGKFSQQIIKLGEASNTEEYQTAISEMNKTFAGAKGFGGTLNAIYRNFKDYPIEFIAEYIGVEGAQEIVPLLIGGAAGVGAKGLTLAKGLGQEIAERIATKAAISSAAASDIAESVGGSAAEAYEDAYKTAIDQGKSEAEATDIALNIATRTGIVAGVTTGLSLRVGGNVLEEALLGKKATGEFANIANELRSRLDKGVKITIKEGVTEAGEEAVIAAAKESLMYSLDPTRDVAKNITLSAAMGGIAGGGIAGTTYGVYTTGDVVSNILLSNPTVSNTITNSASAADADTALANLGITDLGIKTNLLNYKYDADYTSRAEAEAALIEVPGYTFTQNEVDKFVGPIKNVDLTKTIEDYVDPRYVDRDEVIAAAKAENVNLSENAIAKYVGTKDEATSILQIKEELDNKGTTYEEAEQFFIDNYGYKPTKEEVESILTPVINDLNVPEVIALRRIEKYVDPRQVTRTEAEQFFKDLGYTPTEQEIQQYIRQGSEVSQEGVQTEIGEYVNPRQVTQQEVIQAFEDLGFKDVRPEDVASLVGQYEESLLADRAAGKLDEFRYNTLKQNINEIKEAIGAPYRGVTPEDVTFVQDVIAQQQAQPDTVLTPQQLAYDTNQDGVINETDVAFLQNVVRGTVDMPFVPPENTIWRQEPTGIYATLPGQVTPTPTPTPTLSDTEAARLAKTTQQRGNVNTLLQMLGQAPDIAGQQVTVKAPDPLQLRYLYDISGPSIFATPQQEQMFVTPYTPFAKGGVVEDDVTDALLKIVRG